MNCSNVFAHFLLFCFCLSLSLVLHAEPIRFPVLGSSGEMILSYGTKENVVVSQNGKYLATAGSSGVLIWDLESGDTAPQFIINGHTEKINAIDFSSDGSKLLTGSRDNTAILWNTISGSEITRFSGHEDDVRTVTFFHDENRVITSSRDATIRIWDAKIGDEIQRITDVSNNIFTLDISKDDSQFLIIFPEEAVLYDTETGARLRGLPQSSSFIRAVYSPNNRVLLTFGNSLRVLDAASGVSLNSTRFSYQIGAAAFSPDGSRIATRQGNGIITIWDMKNDRPVELKSFENIFHSVNFIQFSPDGNHLFVDGFQMPFQSIHIESEEIIFSIGGHNADTVQKTSFSPDGNYIFNSGDNHTNVWNANDGTFFRTFPGETGVFNYVGKQGDQTTLMTTTRFNANTYLWDLETGLEIRSFESPSISLSESRMLSPDGQHILLPIDTTRASLIDIFTGNELGMFTTGASLSTPRRQYGT